MIDADTFLTPAQRLGFDFYSGVPCSFLTPMINRVISRRNLDYVGAASEGEAVGIAAGAWLAGRRTVVMCQNSGLGNTINPLTSLNFPFRIPTLLIVTWRGQSGLHDEPQHELMGEIVASLLDVVRIPHQRFPTQESAVLPALEAAQAGMKETALPFAFIMEKGSVRHADLDELETPARQPGVRSDLREHAQRPSRIEVLKRFLALAPDTAAVIASTGKCGRELFTLADRRQHLYQVGSMGCAGGIALGLALNTRRPVMVLDGDGAALMKMGTLATIGAQAPRNLIHVILDNEMHDSTGGQATVSKSVDFADVALACGYPRAAACDSLAGFEQAMKEALASSGPHLIHSRIKPGSIENLGRPTVTPVEVARRFKEFLAS